MNAGYRYRKADPLPSKHLYGYATWNRLPWLGASLTLSATWLETSYLQGNIYGFGLTRDLIPGRLSVDLKYRYVDYLYRISERPLLQHVYEASIAWTVARKLYFSAFYEGTFETQASYNRLYLSVTRRF